MREDTILNIRHMSLYIVGMKELRPPSTTIGGKIVKDTGAIGRLNASPDVPPTTASCAALITKLFGTFREAAVAFAAVSWPVG